MKKQHNKEIEQMYGYIVQDPKPNPRTSPPPEGLDDILKKAFNMFNKTKAIWVPAGGIDLTVRFGAVTRNHSDIDIEVEESQLPLLKEGMESQGYKLCEKLASLKLNFPHYKKTITLYKKCTIDENTIKKQLKLIHTDLNNENIHSLLKVIDVKVCRHTPYREAPEGTIISNKGKLITINKPYYSSVIEFKGEPVQLRNLDYHNAIKALEANTSRHKKETDTFDKILSSANRVKYEQGPPVDNRVTYTYREVIEK